MRQWQRMGYIGCLVIALSGILALGGCTALFFHSTQREPELPIRQFMQKQLEVFPPGWTVVLGGDIDYIHTDSEVTPASWAVSASFWYKDGVRISPGVASVSEEVHVFRSAFAAQIDGWRTMPYSLIIGEIYIPRGWTYRPSHANDFEFGCEGGNGSAHPEWCGFIVRYEEYIIVLTTPITDYMTLEDLQRIMEVIDHEMADYLKRSTLRPGPRLVPTTIP